MVQFRIPYSVPRVSLDGRMLVQQALQVRAIHLEGLLLRFNLRR